MPCDRIEQNLDAFFDGDLPVEEAQALRIHLGGCLHCRSAHERELALRAALKRLPIDGPDPGFIDRAMAGAARGTARAGGKRRSRWIASMGAIAASVCVWLLIGSLTAHPTSSATAPEVTIAMESTKSINLVFSAAQDLADARVSLRLPDGLEVNGYAGRKEISWTTDLHKGKNVLRLPLRAHARLADELIAQLDHDSGSKTFRVKVRVI